MIGKKKANNVLRKALAMVLAFCTMITIVPMSSMTAYAQPEDDTKVSNTLVDIPSENKTENVDSDVPDISNIKVETNDKKVNEVNETTAQDELLEYIKNNLNPEYATYKESIIQNMLHIRNTTVDGEYSKGLTLDNLYDDDMKAMQAIISQYDETATVFDVDKDSKYYVAKVDSSINSDVRTTLDDVWAKNDTSGTVASNNNANEKTSLSENEKEKLIRSQEIR